MQRGGSKSPVKNGVKSYWTLDYEVCVEFINQPGCARRNQVMWERESSHIGECAKAMEVCSLYH